VSLTGRVLHFVSLLFFPPASLPAHQVRGSGRPPDELVGSGSCSNWATLYFLSPDAHTHSYYTLDFMHARVRTCTQAPTHTHAHTHTHTNTHTHTYTNIHKRTHTHKHTHTQKHTHTHTYTHKHTHKHAHTRTLTHARTHTCTGACNHARTGALGIYS